MGRIDCGFDGLDCIAFNADYPLCDVDDCLRFMKDYPNCQVEEPNRVGDGECDGGSYNKAECGWDGDDCDCHVDQPAFIGDGNCDVKLIPEINTIECGWDGGDCFIDGLPPPEWWNNDPDCHVDKPHWIGNGYCEGGAY